MTVEQENVSRILTVLSHPIRREILQTLFQKGECSFTDILNALSVDTGKLSFHMRNLAIFLEQTPNGKYKLNRLGENALKLVKDLEAWAGEAGISRNVSTLPIASFKKRALAFLIDLSLMLAVTSLIALPSAFSLFTIGALPFDIGTFIFLTLALLWGYSTLLEGFEGQSLGKRIVGLKVVRINGKDLSYDYAAIRNFGKAFLLPFDLLVGWRIKDDRFIRYFDKFTGTTVVDLRL